MPKASKPFVPFEVGSVYGALTIIRVVIVTDCMATTIYLVEWACCGTRVEVTHRGIIARSNGGFSRCRRCRPTRYVRRHAPRKPVAVVVVDVTIIIDHGPMRGLWPSLKRDSL